VPKRQRTSSPSPTAASKPSNSIPQPASEDESKAKAATNGAKKQKSSSRNQREKETKEPEEPQPERPDTANRRKGRTDQNDGRLQFHNPKGIFNCREINARNRRVRSRCRFSDESRGQRTRTFAAQSGHASSVCSTRASAFSPLHAQIREATCASRRSGRTQPIYARSRHEREWT